MNIHGHSVGASSRWREQKYEKHVSQLSQVKEYGAEL